MFPAHPPRIVCAFMLMAAAALIPGCACHDGDLLRRVPIPEIDSPQLEDPTVAGDPQTPPGDGNNCLTDPTAAYCVAGVGIYVCNSCPGASDANPGTPDQPLLTIGAGIKKATSEGYADVYVANPFTGAAIYREHVVMAPGVSVRGSYIPSSPWVRTSGERTVVENLRAEGLSFPPGITRSTVLDGFEIRSAGAVGGAQRAAAVSIIQSSPTLMDVFAGPLAPGAVAPAHSVGVLVQGDDGAPALPLIKGVSLRMPSTIVGGGGTQTTVALEVMGGFVDVQYADLTGGAPGPGGTARGATFVDAGGRIRDSLIAGGHGEDCVGIESRGSGSGLLVEDNWITGCQPGATRAPLRGAGVVIEDCGDATASAPSVFVRRNPSISGGVVPGGFSVGVASLNGCAPQIVDNPNISAGGEATRAVGVLCSYRTWRGDAGVDSACTLSGNTVLGGLSATVLESVGIQCEGSCATGTADCVGSCHLLERNDVNATAGSSLTHVLVQHASPLIRQNRIGLGGAGLACLHQTTVNGLNLQGSGSRVENNFILAGPCEQVIALVQVNEQRTGDGSWLEPDVHSNTIVGGGSSANTTGSTSFGVQLITPGNVAPPRLGSYRNNVFVGGQNNHRISFAEWDAFSDPRVLDHNDFHNFDRLNGPNPTVYLDENSARMLTAGDIDQLGEPDVAGNLSVDPMFVNTFFDFHVQPITPLLGAGTSVGVPAVDLDGDPRPEQIGQAPTIGADEVH